MRYKALIAPVLALSLCGCAGKMDAKRGLSEEWRLRSLEENFLNFKEGQREQEERGRDQQRKLVERIKAVEDSVQRLHEQMGSGGVAMKKQAPAAPAAAPLASNGGHAAPQAEPAEGPAPTEQKPAPVQAEQKPAPAQAEQKPAPAQAEQKPAPAMGGAGSSLYTEGMRQVTAEHSEEGRKTLQEFLAAEPGSVLVPNALYWIGESYYAEKNYAQAVLSFKEVTRRYPKHHKSAAALLKIGMSYAMMGEKDNASLYLRALLQDFPKSEPAPAARKKLAELGR